MGLTPRRAVPALAVLLLATACGSEPPTQTLSIEAVVPVCAEGAACTSLPAAGALVTVLDGGGAQVADGTLDAAGRFTLDVEEGTYSATVSLPDLGLRTRGSSTNQVSITRGGAASLSLSLPAVTITG